MRTKRIVAVLSFGAGTGLAYATDRFMTGRVPGMRLPLASSGLVGAALVYPVCRRRPRRGMAVAIEWLALGTTAVAGVASARLPVPEQRRVVATGWAAHALFDLFHRRGKRSLIPDWYPAACAGYDLALAALLLSRPE
ncbi:MAG: hypothetical protein ACRDY7_10615 [Acidimicrobiia bacterium]